MDWEEQYARIYRYCYFKVRQRELAEDLTQETFLRFLQSTHYVHTGKAMQYLYTIARNLCIDASRRPQMQTLDEEAADWEAEDTLLTQLSVKMALAQLPEVERELLLLRYVNEVPMSVLGELYGLSCFAVYRRCAQAVKHLKANLDKEDFS